ncbi:hypothetical protein KOI35_00350 [Actinoplanes bogorensis]|uniref:NADH dehydrogenase subunit 6 n=1 Tax=Paractinoplanes bogorensis TaxID=1610840 RepID=A0ABS5YF37_9ACTN|nr:hypothetical protein [Actinoplanes bogorensis]MBU2661946.1 hypothetical protein [Actinoplanes bogorensis]
MIALSSYLGFFVVQIPVVVVLVAGLVMLSAPQRRLPGRSQTLARAGLIVLLAETVASLAWNITFTQIVARSGWTATQFGLISSIVGLMLAVFFAVGLGLLVAGFATVRSETARLSGPFQAAPYSPDSYGPGSVGPDR